MTAVCNVYFNVQINLLKYINTEVCPIKVNSIIVGIEFSPVVGTNTCKGYNLQQETTYEGLTLSKCLSFKNIQNKHTKQS